MLGLGVRVSCEVGGLPLTERWLITRLRNQRWKDGQRGAPGGGLRTPVSQSRFHIMGLVAHPSGESVNRKKTTASITTTNMSNYTWWVAHTGGQVCYLRLTY